MDVFERIRRYIPLLLLVILAMVFFRNSVNAQVFAQTAPGEVLQQLERDRQQQELQKKEKEQKKPPVILQQKEPVKPSAGPAAKILVKKFKVEGNKLISTNVINSLVAPYEGKELTLEEIRNIADLITAKYRDKGYIIANAIVPEQVIKDNVVTIKVVEGRVEAIMVTGNKSYSTSFIEKHLSVIENDPSLKEDRLEKALLILNDYPSLNVSASLKAGKEPGTTDVIAQATDKFPISGSIFYDNYGTSATSKDRVGFGLNTGNLVTSGDALNLWGLTGVDPINVNDLSYGRVEYNAPIGIYGTKAGVYYAHNLYQATGNVSPLGLKGNADIAGVYVSHPLIKTMDSALTAKVGFDYKDVREYALEQMTAKDNVRVGTFGLAYDSTDRFLGRNFIDVTYHQGIRGFLDGNGANGTDTSRLGSDEGFNKVTGDIIRIQQLPMIPGYNHLILKGSGQYSSNPLVVVEQFLIGGEGSVRGFNPAEKAGDTGYSLTAEAVLSPFFADDTIFGQKVGNTIQYAFFFDQGYVRNNMVQPGGYQQAYLTGTGAGLRIYAGKIFSLKIDYGIPRVDGSFQTSKAMTYVQAIFYF
jgi:hemolysin activation/secretion protein